MAKSLLFLVLLLLSSYHCFIIYILVGSGGFLRTVKSSVTSIWKESKASKDRYDCITFLCVAIFNLFILIYIRHSLELRAIIDQVLYK